MIINWACAEADPRPVDTITATITPPPSLDARIASSPDSSGHYRLAVMLTRYAPRGKDSARGQPTSSDSRSANIILHLYGGAVATSRHL
jgi:hypothetical protein